MAKKTVINRACKLLIASSDDSVLMEPGEDGRMGRAKAEIESVANQGSVIDIPEEEPIQVAEEVTEVSAPAPAKPENKREWKNEASPNVSVPATHPSPKEPGF
jgi:recombinational DNA repair protein RecT